MAGDILKVSGQVRLWNMPEDVNVTVCMLWEDHVGPGDTKNSSLGFAGVSSSSGGRYSAVWYGFNETNETNSLYLDLAAGITNLSFVVNGTLEDQGGLGFAIQNSFMLSETSCKIEDPFTGRMDVAVRNGVNPARVYLEEVTTDSVSRPIIVEIDITPPAEPVAANSAYSLWSINLTDPNTFYSIGTEIDGVRYSTNDQHTFNEFPICPTS